jgi:hypothetical protein
MSDFWTFLKEVAELICLAFFLVLLSAIVAVPVIGVVLFITFLVGVSISVVISSMLLAAICALTIIVLRKFVS